MDSLFNLVDLEYLFLTKLLPPKGNQPTWALSTISGDMTNPNSVGFGFLLITSDSHAVT
jgi:hypothetical protein